MKVLISGASGFLGTELVARLILEGYEIDALSRSPDANSKSYPYPIQFISWQDLDQNDTDYDYIIHLAGANIADKRWSKKQKEILYQSRIDTGKRLVAKALRQKQPPKKFLCGAASGIYGDAGDQEINEDSQLSRGFLGKLCKDWEALCRPLEDKQILTAQLRTGIVLGTNEGALKQLVMLTQLGALSCLGDGKQFMPWIHVQDWVEATYFIMQSPELTGPINMVNSKPIRQKDFFKTLSSHFHMWMLPPVPSFLVKLLFGEMSQILLNSLNINHSKLLNHGFEFHYLRLEDALKDLYPEPTKDLIFQQNLLLPQQVEEIFPFFSDPNNLEKITPDFLNFKVKSSSDEVVKKNTLIKYRLSLHGIPMFWKTKILDYQENSHFIDNQESGPYKRWHHLHTFERHPRGTLMKDTVRYNVGFGILGKAIAYFYVNKDVQKIFDYRTKVLKKIYCANVYNKSS